MRREERLITKHTINLYKGDYAKLQTLYSSRVTAGKVIRDIVHAYLRKIEEDAGQKATLINDLEIELTTGPEA